MTSVPPSRRRNQTHQNGNAIVRRRRSAVLDKIRSFADAVEQIVNQGKDRGEGAQREHSVL